MGRRLRLSHGCFELGVRRQAERKIAVGEHRREQTVDRGLSLAGQRVHFGKLGPHCVGLGFELPQTGGQMHTRRA